MEHIFGSSRLVATPRAFSYLSDPSIAPDRKSLISEAVSLALQPRVVPSLCVNLRSPLWAQAWWNDGYIIALHLRDEVRHLGTLQADFVPLSFM
jgi:hypothetical protein